MALRNIREIGERVLGKTCRPVPEITPKIVDLVQDMLETMYDACGVGLAAPQVGILKRIVVIDVDPEEANPFIMINPEIIEVSEETQTGEEGCLSVPGKSGVVTRPMRVKAKARDLNYEEYEIEAEGLLARAICHELDHLDGILYVSKVEGELHDAGFAGDPDEIEIEE